MSLKVLFEPGSGQILGAQTAGFTGVDKWIDVLSTAIQAGFKSHNLTQLELAYAPPYSTAKSPVNIAGAMIEDLRLGLVKHFHWHEVEALPHDGQVTLLDVCSPDRYAQNHLNGFFNIPFNDLRARMGELPVGRPVYINCFSGLHSYYAARLLAQKGFEAFYLNGGSRLYQAVSGAPARN